TRWPTQTGQPAFITSGPFKRAARYRRQTSFYVAKPYIACFCMKNLETILVPLTVRLPELLTRMEHAPGKGLPGGILLAVDESGVLRGTITDGDIRRALIRNASL